MGFWGVVVCVICYESVELVDGCGCGELGGIEVFDEVVFVGVVCFFEFVEYFVGECEFVGDVFIDDCFVGDDVVVFE